MFHLVNSYGAWALNENDVDYEEYKRIQQRIEMEIDTMHTARRKKQKDAVQFGGYSIYDSLTQVSDHL